MIAFSSMPVYYVLSLLLIGLIFLPVQINHNHYSETLTPSIVIWLTACFVISIPLLLEFVVDFGVSLLHSDLSPNKSVKEHNFAQFLLIMSLIPPFILAFSNTNEVSLDVTQCVVSFCHGLAVCSVYGKLISYDPNVWKSWFVLPVISFFVASQILFSSSKIQCIDQSNILACQRSIDFQISALVMSILTFLFHVLLSRSYWQEVFGRKFHFSNSNSLLCLLESTLLSLYFFARIILLVVPIALPSTDHEAITVHIVLLMILVVVTAVLPVRRRLLTLKNEMETNKTFVRYISHEIRSPLSTTSLGLDYLLERMPTGAIRYSDVLDVIRDAKVTCEIATCTLNDLLMFDKMETGMLDVTPVECNARDYVINCAKTFQLQAAGEGVKLSCITDGTIDDFALDCESNIGLKIDKYKMEQVLRNFISNALKFTPRNGAVEIRMALGEGSVVPRRSSNNGSIRSSRKYVGRAKVDVEIPPVFRVEVVDNGPGISAENLPKLFGQYVQFDANTLQGGKGSGLGLWLSKTIVEMHGGVIGAKSEGLGHGCTFFFELPCFVLKSAIDELIVPAESQSFTKILSRPNSTDEFATATHSSSVSVVGPVRSEPDSPTIMIHSADTTVTALSPRNMTLSPNGSFSGSFRRSTMLPRRKTVAVDNNDLSILRYDADGYSSLRPRCQKGNAIILPPIRQLKVLLVDDSVLARKMVDRSLVGMYRECHHAGNGLEAVNLVIASMSGTQDIEAQKTADPYDVVLMDYYMPVMSGPEATKRLRELGYKGIILAVTGNSCSEEQFEMLNCGVDRVLVKPFNLEVFRSAINGLKSKMSDHK